MIRRLTVVYLPVPGPSPLIPWGEAVVAAIGKKHHIRIYDPNHPMAPQVEDAEVIVDWSGSYGTPEMVAAARSLRLWQFLITGLDHVDLECWRARGIPVANCPGFSSAVALAELAMMFILMLARKYPIAWQNLQKGLYFEPVGQELAGLRLGLIGFGASARELARRAQPFGLRVSAVVRDVHRVPQQEYCLEEAVGLEALDRIVAESDILSLHVPLTSETYHILDARRLSLMKPTAFLINVARGALVDEVALEKALAEGRLGGAGLDVFSMEPPDLNSPLFRLPNVITTPHIAASTREVLQRRAAIAAENADRVAAGLEPLYRVI
ncbi:MAG: 2-hydroxyacid dehydrogenase [Anaerolineae bacterium]